MPINSAILFTWDIELVLLALVALSLTSTLPSYDVTQYRMSLWASYSLLATSVVVTVGHAVCQSMLWDRWHLSLSTPTLSTVIGIAVVRLRSASAIDTSQPGGALAFGVVCAYVCIVLVVAFGATFASMRTERTGPAFLFLHKYAVMGIVWPVALATIGHMASYLCGSYEWILLLVLLPLITIAVFQAFMVDSIALVLNAICILLVLILQTSVAELWWWILVMGATLLAVCAWFVVSLRPVVPEGEPSVEEGRNSAPALGLDLRAFRSRSATREKIN